MVLLAAVPPLILSGQPMAAAAQALPRPWLRPLHRFGAHAHGRLLAALAMASIAHGVVMWGWHLPAATAAALEHEGIHVLMHASFLFAGIWFWSALLRCMREIAIGVGAALVALVAVMMQMGLLGALLTFAPRILYPVYAARAPQIGLDPLVDQQLAGLIMWVPACLPYLIGAIWLLKRSFDRASPAVEQRERAAMRGSSPHTGRSV
jgi:putative membrane protein